MVCFRQTFRLSYFFSVGKRCLDEKRQVASNNFEIWGSKLKELIDNSLEDPNY